jgi:hypothetical protein
VQAPVPAHVIDKGIPSFASPLVLRTAAAARAMSETPLTATTLRALLIHRAKRSAGHDTVDVGWGRFPVSGWPFHIEAR